MTSFSDRLYCLAPICGLITLVLFIVSIFVYAFIYGFTMNHIYYENQAAMLTTINVLCQIAVKNNITCPEPIYYKNYAEAMNEARSVYGVAVEVSPVFLGIIMVVMVIVITITIVVKCGFTHRSGYNNLPAQQTFTTF